jgi:hypothetical protein
MRQWPSPLLKGIINTGVIMANINILAELLTVIGGLLLLLIALLGWIGSRVHDRLDEISKSLSKIEVDLKEDIAILENRITKVETHQEYLTPVAVKPVTKARQARG